MFLILHGKNALWFNVTIVIVVFGLGFGLGMAAYRTPTPVPEYGSTCSIERDASPHFTNPLLDCELADGKINRELVPFKPAIQQLVDSYRANNMVQHTSVYFRDLNNGAWFGIDEKQVYSPASLLKVPVMMAYYRWEQDEPGVMQRSFRLAERDAEAGGYEQFIESESEIAVGKTYTVEDLVERMMVYSDNQANYLLRSKLSPTRLEHVFQLLGLPDTGLQVIGAELTVKQYASFFRILYNSSYLREDLSDAALKLMSRSTFRAGLVAGLPDGTVTSHKFGERGIAKGVKQFHDCGIVYYPQRPYLLCVMTQGADYWQQINVISGISKSIYEQVDEQFKAE